MSAATDAFDSKQYTGSSFPRVPVKDATTVYKGTLIMADSNGKALPAVPAANVTFLGVGRQTVVNPSGGSLKVDVDQGVFGGFGNSASAALTAAYIGKPAYCEDDNTVKNAAGTNGFAVGIFLGFDEDGKCIIDTTRRA